MLTEDQKKMIKDSDVDAICKSIIDEKGNCAEKCMLAKQTVRMFLRQNRLDTRDFLNKLAHKRAPFIQRLVKGLVEEKNQNLTVAQVCASITARQFLETSDEQWLLIMLECLRRYPLEAVNAMADTDGTALMEVLIKKQTDIVLDLLQKKDVSITGKTLKMLEGVANSVVTSGLSPTTTNNDVRSMIMDILENSVHMENWTGKGTDVLKVARKLNPVHPFKDDTICIDTPYIMNWGEKHRYFLSPGKTDIHVLIEKLSKKIIKGSPPLVDARKFIKKNTVVDLLMFLPEKRYRGHDIHHFNVAALGLLFLNTYVKKGQTLKEYVRLRHNWPNERDVEKAWLVASLLHDHALPISYMFRIAPLVCNAKKAKESSRRAKSYARAMRKIQTTLEATYKRPLFSQDLWDIYERFRGGYDDKTMMLDRLISREMRRIEFHKVDKDKLLNHGVLGAVNIASRHKTALDDRILKTALRALAVHGLDDRISFKEHPIDFLLVLCDELQEWGREIAFFPEILIEASSMRIGKFYREKENLSFTRKLSVSYRFLPCCKRTNFHAGLWMQGKADLVNRLDFDDHDIYPQKIHFKSPPKTSPLSATRKSHSPTRPRT